MSDPRQGLFTFTKSGQLGLPDKGRAINGLVVCNNVDLEPVDMLNGLTLGCFQPSPEVSIVLKSVKFIKLLLKAKLFYN